MILILEPVLICQSARMALHVLLSQFICLLSYLSHERPRHRPSPHQKKNDNCRCKAEKAGKGTRLALILLYIGQGRWKKKKKKARLTPGLQPAGSNLTVQLLCIAIQITTKDATFCSWVRNYKVQTPANIPSCMNVIFDSKIIWHNCPAKWYNCTEGHTLIECSH